MNTFRTIPYEIILSEADTSLEESRIPKRVQILRTGTYYHPEYGKLDITQNMLLGMKKNHDDKVRGIDIGIDFGHKSDEKYAGWITDLELTENDTELWANVNWNPSGKESLIKKEYRYISADFSQNYKNNETLLEHGPCLLGAGLTNRPVIKNMTPVIELSETTKPNEGGIVMEQKIKELEAKIAELTSALEALKPGNAGNKEVMEENDTLKNENKMLSEKIKKSEDEKKLAEKNKSFDALLTSGKAVEAQRESFISGDTIKFAELSQPVKLATVGNGEDNGKETKEETVEEKIMKFAEKKLTDKEAVSLSEAISMVLRENKELNKAYNK